MNEILTNSAKDAKAALGEALGQLTEIYASADEGMFSAGWVDSVTDEHVRILSVDPCGRTDGIQVLSLNTVNRVITGGEYLELKLEPLMELWPKPLWPEQRLTGQLSDLMLDALTLSLEDGLVVSIRGSNDKEYNGPVVKLTDDAGAIQSLDSYGRMIGAVTFKVADLEALCLGSEDEMVWQHLMKTNNPR